MKRKLKGSNKGHSHSSTNANKNIENNKINKMPVSTYMSYLSPGNNNLIKKKKKENVGVDKSLKHHLMLTSMNNSSIINSSKDKILSYMNNISNYQSNKTSKHNNIMNPNLKKKTSFKNSITNITNATNANNSCQNIGPNDNESSNQKKFSNSQIELNNVKKKNKDKKYSLTTMNSRKNSVEKEEHEIVKKLNKINFNGIFKNYNLINKKIISTSKNSTKNIDFGNKINKKLFVGDFFNLKKSGKYINNFFEIYLKDQQNNNNKKSKKNINTSSQNQHKSMSNYKNNGNSTTTNNTITPNSNSNTNFSPSNGSPASNNKFYKTAKVSPRASFPKKNQEIQSHRINFKNKISGNILAFYNNHKKNLVNNDNKFLLYGNSYNVDNNSNYINNKINSQIIKKSKKNISVNMNITSNNNNYNLSNMKNSNLISNSNFAKSSSLNKIKNNNYVTNYNNFYNNNNSFINKKVINPIMNHTKKNSSENQNSNIINNCQININNINYNNYNQNITQ